MKCCLLYSSASSTLFLLWAAIFAAFTQKLVARRPIDDNVQSHNTNFLSNTKGPIKETSVKCVDQSVYCAQFHEMLKFQCQDLYFGEAIRAGCPLTCNQCGGKRGNLLIHSHPTSGSSASSSSKEGERSAGSSEEMIPFSSSIDLEQEAFDVVDEKNPLDTTLTDLGDVWTDEDEAEARQAEQERNHKAKASVNRLQKPVLSLFTKNGGSSSKDTSSSPDSAAINVEKEKMDARLWDYSTPILKYVSNSRQVVAVVPSEEQSHPDASSADYRDQEYGGLEGTSNGPKAHTLKRSLKYR